MVAVFYVHKTCLNFLGVRTELIGTGLGILCTVYDQNDRTGDWDQAEQDESPSLTDVMQPANTYRKTGKQNGKREEK